MFGCFEGGGGAGVEGLGAVAPHCGFLFAHESDVGGGGLKDGGAGGCASARDIGIGGGVCATAVDVILILGGLHGWSGLSA